MKRGIFLFLAFIFLYNACTDYKRSMKKLSQTIRQEEVWK
jgi:hypothetical protein